MYRRPRHQAVAALLGTLNCEVLRATRCHFGGGTAIALTVDEFRESADVDFLCSDLEGYRRLRAIVFTSDIDGLFLTPPRKLRETRADRDGVRNFVDVDGMPIKIEIIQEARIALTPSTQSICGVPMLELHDLMAEKLLANTDRGMDRATSHRDAIDLLALISRHGEISNSAWELSRSAYGDAVERAWRSVCHMLRSDPPLWQASLNKLSVDPAWQKTLHEVLFRQV